MPNKKNGVVQLTEVKGMIRKAIKENYGSVAKFLGSDIARQIGSKYLRQYICDSGSVNVKVLNMLCEHFGIGTLTAETKRVTTTTYRLTKE